MINVAIVEDERLAARELEKNLLSLRPGGIDVKVKLENVSQAVVWFSENQVDLIFMDVHLGDGNSFSIFEQIKLKTPVIFTTAYDQYAIQAFKQCSIDYLLKPIDEDDLEQALDKYDDMFAKPKSLDIESLQNSLQSIIGGNKYQERFMVSRGERILSMDLEQVSYFMADGKACYLFSKDGTRYLFDGTLANLEKKLDPNTFFRINRKFIVSYSCIIDMVYYSKTRIKLNLKPTCEEAMDAIVSQDKCAEFKRWLNQ
ncbi:LytR/AlgR family response regulator transcription factor [Ancylomarina sp. YFZ004]